MTVIHANFGGASAPPTPPQAPQKTTDQVIDALLQGAAGAARAAEGMTPDERADHAKEAVARAERFISLGMFAPASIDPVIQYLIEARLMMAATGGASRQEEASTGAPLGARELADAAIRWINEEVATRSDLTPAQRRERAEIYMETAIECLEDPKAPVWASAIGRNAWAARIMMAEKD